MSSEPARHSVSVAGIVIDDHGRALLTRRRDNHRWEPPGGVLELAEPVDEGLRREVREETGLDVEPVRLTGIYKNMNRGIVALVFLCKVTGGQLATSSETDAFRWAAENEVSELTSEVYAVRVTDAMHDRSSPAIRQHDGHQLI